MKKKTSQCPDKPFWVSTASKLRGTNWVPFLSMRPVSIDVPVDFITVSYNKHKFINFNQNSSITRVNVNTEVWQGKSINSNMWRLVTIVCFKQEHRRWPYTVCVNISQYWPLQCTTLQQRHLEVVFIFRWVFLIFCSFAYLFGKRYMAEVCLDKLAFLLTDYGPLQTLVFISVWILMWGIINKFTLFVIWNDSLVD